jgi:hypothetical protein
MAEKKAPESMDEAIREGKAEQRSAEREARVEVRGAERVEVPRRSQEAADARIGARDDEEPVVVEASSLPPEAPDAAEIKLPRDLRTSAQRARAAAAMQDVPSPGIVPPELRDDPEHVKWALQQPHAAAFIPKEELMERVRAGT